MNPTKMTKKGVVTDKDVVVEDPGEISVSCIMGLLKNTNAVTLKGVISLVFTILDSANQLDEPGFALYLLSIFLSGAEVILFIIATLTYW